MSHSTEPDGISVEDRELKPAISASGTAGDEEFSPSELSSEIPALPNTEHGDDQQEAFEFDYDPTLSPTEAAARGCIEKYRLGLGMGQGIRAIYAGMDGLTLDPETKQYKPVIGVIVLVVRGSTHGLRDYYVYDRIRVPVFVKEILRLEAQ